MERARTSLRTFARAAEGGIPLHERAWLQRELRALCDHCLQHAQHEPEDAESAQRFDALLRDVLRRTAIDPAELVALGDGIGRGPNAPAAVREIIDGVAGWVEVADGSPVAAHTLTPIHSLDFPRSRFSVHLRLPEDVEFLEVSPDWQTSREWRLDPARWLAKDPAALRAGQGAGAAVFGHGR